MPGGKILDVEAGMGVRDYKELYLYYKVKAADTPGNMTWMLDPDADCFKGGRVYEAIPYNGE